MNALFGVIFHGWNSYAAEVHVRSREGQMAYRGIIF